MSNQSIPSASADRSESLGLPVFAITRREDLSLQFHPPIGSLELANALSLKYPMQPSLQKQIQCALIDHIDSERQCSSSTDFPRNGTPMPPTLPPNSTAHLDGIPGPGKSMAPWSVITGRPVIAKRRKKSYDEGKRHKVAKVRKSGACEFHRRKKTECNCLRNTTRYDLLSNSESSHFSMRRSPDRTHNVSPSITPTENAVGATPEIASLSFAEDNLSGTHDFSFFNPTFQEGQEFDFQL